MVLLIRPIGYVRGPRSNARFTSGIGIATGQFYLKANQSIHAGCAAAVAA
jgi:hypothetical protein